MKLCFLISVSMLALLSQSHSAEGNWLGDWFASDSDDILQDLSDNTGNITILVHKVVAELESQGEDLTDVMAAQHSVHHADVQRDNETTRQRDNKELIPHVGRLGDLLEIVIQLDQNSQSVGKSAMSKDFKELKTDMFEWEALLTGSTTADQQRLAEESVPVWQSMARLDIYFENMQQGPWDDSQKTGLQDAFSQLSESMGIFMEYVLPNYPNVEPSELVSKTWRNVDKGIRAIYVVQLPEPISPVKRLPQSPKRIGKSALVQDLKQLKTRMLKWTMDGTAKTDQSALMEAAVEWWKNMARLEYYLENFQQGAWDESETTELRNVFSQLRNSMESYNVKYFQLFESTETSESVRESWIQLMEDVNAIFFP